MKGLRLAIAFACVSLSACHSSTQAPVTVENAWSPATPPNATVAAAYMQISARSTDVLLSAVTPAAGHVEMHTSTEAGGMMRMRPLEQVAIRADETVRFEPGAHHFMLMDLQAPLTAGSTLPITLRFQNAGEITVAVAVKAQADMHSSR